ncbi:MAG: hypothetical protein RR053_04270 [Evtepia sp.]
MKKLLILALAFALTLSMAACGANQTLTSRHPARSLYQYVITDIFGNSYESDMAKMDSINGEITVEMT